MDAKELSQTLISCAAPVASRPGYSCDGRCVPSTCRPGCSLEVLDALLSIPGAATAAEADELLDLRQLLKARRDAEGALRVFSALRVSLEQRHYLAFYRIRRWLENQVAAEVKPSAEAPPVQVHLRLNAYCVETVRRQCLCTALDLGVALSAPQLTFFFVPLDEPGMPQPANASCPKPA